MVVSFTVSVEVSFIKQAVLQTGYSTTQTGCVTVVAETTYLELKSNPNTLPISNTHTIALSQLPSNIIAVPSLDAFRSRFITSEP